MVLMSERTVSEDSLSPLGLPLNTTPERNVHHHLCRTRVDLKSDVTLTRSLLCPGKRLMIMYHLVSLLSMFHTIIQLLS